MSKKTGFFVCLLVAVFLISFSGGIQAASYDPKLKWKTVETPHFAIHYYAGEEEVVEKLRATVEEVYGSLSQKFDARPWGRTQVIVVDNYDQANGLATVIPYNTVILRVVPPTSQSSLANYDDWLKTLFAHEYTHVIHLSDTRYPAKALKLLFGKVVAPNALTPGWVIEGLATHMETAETGRGRGTASYTDMLLRTAILQGKFLKLDQMAGTQIRWPSWMSQYLYGVAFWRYLEETYGAEKVYEFSHRYGASLRFFFLSSQSKKIFKDDKGRGKSFQDLWVDWKSSLEGKYAVIEKKIQHEGYRPGSIFLQPKKEESFQLPTFSPDGKKLAYIATSIHHPSELRLRDLATGKERVLLKKQDIDAINFDPKGLRIFFSSVKSYRSYYSFSDLWEFDLATDVLTSLTKGKRARDPAVSPDGTLIAAVIQKTGFSVLGVFDRKEKSWKEFSRADGFDHPQWFPDGRSLVVSAQRDGERNLWKIDLETGEEKKLTRGISLEDRPLIDPTGKVIYFSSDEGGIFNLHRQDLYSGKSETVTNVLTGAFEPTLSPEGDLVYKYYTGDGYEFRSVKVAVEKNVKIPHASKGILGPLFPLSESEKKSELEGAKSYRPFKTLFLPRVVYPNVAFIDGSFFLSAAVVNHDPLLRHLWSAFVNYRSDNDFVGFGGSYTYNRFRAPVYAGFNDYVVNYGDIFGSGDDFFEERRRAYVGISYPWAKQRLSVNYFFENRSEESGLPAGTTLQTFGHYAGISTQFFYRSASGTGARISPESGGQVSVNFEVTNKAFGASEELEQEVIWGDARAYVRVPGTRHHVIALRGAAGVSFGDPFLQGNFSLGGSLGEGPFSVASTRLFTLRGLPLSTFSKDHAWVASVEYRVPLFRLERGWRLMPIALNTAHLAIFTDVGDAFNRGQSKWRPLLGVGAELRGDFILGYHLPVMGRLGYGVVLTHRERFAGVEDALTGFDARNGVVVLEVGMSF